jgi:hypothetical protein
MAFCHLLIAIECIKKIDETIFKQRQFNDAAAIKYLRDDGG